MKEIFTVEVKLRSSQVGVILWENEFLSKWNSTNGLDPKAQKYRQSLQLRKTTDIFKNR